MRQETKLNWLSLGDENTIIFHRFLAANKKKNLIAELINDHKIPTISFKEIEDLILEFYRSLYTKTPDYNVITINLQRKSMNHCQKKFLTTRFKINEIKNALCLLGKNKALKRNGFTTEYLLKFWNFFQGKF